MFALVQPGEVPADLRTLLWAIVQSVLTEQGMLALIQVKGAPGGPEGVARRSSVGMEAVQEPVRRG